MEFNSFYEHKFHMPMKPCVGLADRKAHLFGSQPLKT